MASRKLKVYGWIGFRVHGPHRQSREVVAASSLAEAAHIAGYNRPSQMFNLCETGNGPEVAQATSEPGVIFWHPLDERPYTWRRVEPAVVSSLPGPQRAGTSRRRSQPEQSI